MEKISRVFLLSRILGCLLIFGIGVGSGLMVYHFGIANNLYSQWFSFGYEIGKVKGQEEAFTQYNQKFIEIKNELLGLRLEADSVSSIFLGDDWIRKIQVLQDSILAFCDRQNIPIDSFLPGMTIQRLAQKKPSGVELWIGGN